MHTKACGMDSGTDRVWSTGPVVTAYMALDASDVVRSLSYTLKSGFVCIGSETEVFQ